MCAVRWNYVICNLSSMRNVVINFEKKIDGRKYLKDIPYYGLLYLIVYAIDFARLHKLTIQIVL